MFKFINFEFFDFLHSNFRGDTEEIFAVCAECGGACEYNKMSCLLPGEAEYMADQAKLPLKLFRDKYLDGVSVDGVVVDMLKTGICPFLHSECFSCNVKHYKPILCLIYPIVFERVDREWQPVIEDWCPMSKREKAVSYFKNEGMELVRKLRPLLDDKFLEIIHFFDQPNYDYDRMFAERGVPMHVYKVYSKEALISYQKR
jgi:Fe-S-cluster containining protein